METPLTIAKTDLPPQWMRETVLGRFGQPWEIAKAVEYFLSEESAFCCGSELLIDGGFALR